MEAQVHSHQRNVPLSRIQLTGLPVMCAPEVDTARKILPPRMRAGLGFTPILQVRSFMMLIDFLLFNATCNDCDYLVICLLCQICFGKTRAKGTFGIRVKLPPVYQTQSRLVFFNAERLANKL